MKAGSTRKNGDLADEIRVKLALPVDTPKRIEQGTMQRFENWIVSPPLRVTESDQRKVEQILAKIEAPVRRNVPSDVEAIGELDS